MIDDQGAIAWTVSTWLLLADEIEDLGLASF